MSTAHILLSSFNAGEVSQLMGSRFGVEKVASGCRQLRNFIIHAHGPAFRRPGMEFMGMAASHDTPSNLRSFQFSSSTVAMLELSVFGLRVWKDASLVSLLQPVLLPYAAEELPDVQMCQVNDVVYLTHPHHEPRKLIRYADNDWRIQVLEWRFPPLLDENPGDQAMPDQYDTLSSNGLAPFNHVGYYVNFPGGSSNSVYCELLNVGMGVNSPTHLTILGTPPSGDVKRILVQRRFANTNTFQPKGWQSVASATWQGALPDIHPIPLVDPITTNAATGDYRIYFKGSVFPGGKLRLKTGYEWDLAANGYEWISGAGSGPAATTIQPGAWRYSIDMGGSPLMLDEFGSQRPTYVALQKRDTPGSGDWEDYITFDPTIAHRQTVTEITPTAIELRWRADNFLAVQNADVTGWASASIEALNNPSPYQTSIAIDHVEVGSGRELTSNRPLFKPGHVGSYWQLTHRREDAFVEIVSTSEPVAATGVLNLPTNPVANATVTIGSRTYTFVATPTLAGHVDLGANAATSASNLAAAINAGAGAGTAYHGSTAAHADVTATVSGTTVTVLARKPGTGAHAVHLTMTVVGGSWDDVFLHGGVDANTVITPAQTSGLRINGTWEVFTYGSWESTLYLERLNASGQWDFVRSWRSKKDRNISASGETDGDETLRLRIIAGSSSETSTAAAPRFLLEAADARINGLVKITAVGALSEGKSVNATCDVITPLLSTAPTYVWTEGAWSQAQGFPSAVAMHQNRLWFAGTAKAPMRIWGSVSGDIENFRRSSLDDGSVSWTPLADELNPIQWMISQGADMVIGTGGDEWTLSGQGKAITPSNFDFQRQSRFGSSAVAAIMANEVVVFVQRGGRKVRRVSQRSNNEPWSTSDMTVLAEHIALDGIKQLAFGSNPNSILWAVTTSGKLLGMTLEVEQNVFGWHVHETDGQVESVAVIYGDDADEVWLAVRRGSLRTIERLDPRVFARDFTDYPRMIYADSAVRYDGEPTTSIPGLTHLNGKTVSLLADGVELTPQVVSGGALTLPSPASVVVVGLPFTSTLQPCRFDVQSPKGSAQGLMWRVSRIGLYVHDSQGGQVAEHPASTFEALPYPASGLYSGDVETVVESSARPGTDALVKTSTLLPLTIGSLLLKLDLYGD
ncbi:hypothetical protein SAMN02745166_05012 [Prosthecobacter debontii]|uniref:Uncharacterized protein n=1 Tax=Prosthecobacter debontii TaxID=48467 RepID=A0A1T4Z592_9BACT|nr:hypothetical protein [Prosthecobacter debontii]SKB08731.1 hypothetical protein SAMN02745166_05012 [Prosthecobacter debontii]